MFKNEPTGNLRICSTCLLPSGRDETEFLSEKTVFRKIESSYSSFDKLRIEKLLALLKQTQQLEPSPDEQKNAVFLIAEDKELGVYGGAVLLNKRMRNLYRSQDSHFDSKVGSVWNCYSVLSLKNKDPLYMDSERIMFCQSFYHELHTKLIELGKQAQIPFLWVTLDNEEELCMKKLGAFSFLTEVKPQEAMDGLFHGILWLTPPSSKINLKSSNPQKHTQQSKALPLRSQTFEERVI